MSVLEGVAEGPDDEVLVPTLLAEGLLVPAPLGLPRQPGARRRRGLGLIVAASLLGALAVVALMPGALAPDDPYRLDLANRLTGPSASHWLGTDQFGRDLLSRLIWGTRATLGASLLVLAATTMIGGAVAVGATFGSRPLRIAALRMIDLFLALPQLIVAFAIVGLLGPGFLNTLIALAVTGWAGEARVLRGLLAAQAGATYVEAAKAVGASRCRLLGRHVLPAITGRAAVVVSLRLGHTILALSSLSFLGLGAQPPSPEWGAMLGEAQAYLLRDPALVIVPGLAVVLTVAASNILADTVSDRLDVRRP